MALRRPRGPKYVVYGAGGNVGSEIAAALLDRGGEVVAPVRNTRADLPAGVVAVDARWNDITCETILSGAEALFLLPGLAETRLLLERAKHCGVKRVVVLSSASVGDPRNVDALTQFHRRAEEAVLESGLDSTILRPQAFGSNALRWLPQVEAGDEIRVPFPDLAVASIDPRDVATVAVLAMRTREHIGASYRLTGPFAQLPAEQIELIGRAAGRKLHAVGLDDAHAREFLLQSTPARLVDAFFTLYRGGAFDESLVTDTFSSVVGRPAASFSQWLDRHKERFAAATPLGQDRP